MFSNNIHSLFLSEFQSDKASMLDEAIEYLKSLQLQVQVIFFFFFKIFFCTVPSSIYVNKYRSAHTQFLHEGQLC